MYSEYMKYHYVHVSHFSRHLAEENGWASGETSRRCDPAKAMLPVHFCNVDFSQIFHNAHVVHDKWWLWGHRILGQNHFSRHGLWHKRENASITVQVSYNATQPENLRDRNRLPCGLRKNLGAVTLQAVVRLLTQIGTSMSTTETPLTAMKTCTGSLQLCRDEVKAHFPQQQFSAFFLLH